MTKIKKKQIDRHKKTKNWFVTNIEKTESKIKDPRNKPFTTYTEKLKSFSLKQFFKMRIFKHKHKSRQIKTIKLKISMTQRHQTDRKTNKFDISWMWDKRLYNV